MKLTCVVFVVGIANYVLALSSDFDLSDAFSVLHARTEGSEIDELVIAAIFLAFAVAIDSSLLRLKLDKELEVESAKRRTLEATMNSVQHIVNNTFEILQAIRMRAEAANVLEPDAARQFDEVIRSAANRIRKLSEVTEIKDKHIAAGIREIDYEP